MFIRVYFVHFFNRFFDDARAFIFFTLGLSLLYKCISCAARAVSHRENKHEGMKMNFLSEREKREEKIRVRNSNHSCCWTGSRWRDTKNQADVTFLGTKNRLRYFPIAHAQSTIRLSCYPIIRATCVRASSSVRVLTLVSTPPSHRAPEGYTQPSTPARPLPRFLSRSLSLSLTRRSFFLYFSVLLVHARNTPLRRFTSQKHSQFLSL